MYKDVLLEISALKGDAKLVEDFSDYFSIRKITDEDRQKLSDLSVKFSKSSDKHQLALLNAVERTYQELAKEKNFLETSKKIVQDLFNSVTKIRYFITDAIRFVLFKTWDYLPKAIKDPVNSLYTTYFEQHVLKLTNFFNQYVIVLFGIRMKLTEFIKNMFMVIAAGLIIHYVFFKATGKVETPLDESTQKSIFAYAYTNSFLFLEGWLSMEKKVTKESITATAVRDIPERPKPKMPYGAEEPKTVYERIVEFFAEIGNEIRKTITTNIGKLIGLMIAVPLLIITLIGMKKLIDMLDEGTIKNFLSDTVNSICSLLRIQISKTA